MSAISLKSITGITSITTPAGVDNQLTLHNNNTTEAVKLDTEGNLHFHNHLNITGVSTASNFKTGSTNVHSTGVELVNINTGGGTATFGGGITVAGAIDANGDLDVDGHTNLDNVSVAGITTTRDINIEDVSPRLTFFDTNADANEKKWDFKCGSNNEFIIQGINDAGSGGGHLFKMTRVSNSNGIDTFEAAKSGTTWLTISNQNRKLTTRDLDVTNNLDVDGHTNLDNVSIAGVATITAAQADVATFTSNQTASTIYVKDTDGDGIFISGSSAYGHRIYTNTTEDLLLGTNSTGRLRITSAGKVGIGTINPNPQSMLDVSELSTGQSETQKRIAIFRKNGTAVGDEGYIHLTTMTGHYGVKLGFANEGASPSYLNQGFYISTVNDAENITNHEKRFVIKSDGKIGIGTDNPTYKIHVDSGDAAIGLWKSRRSSGSYIEYAVGANGAALGYIGAGGQIISSAGADSGDFAIRSQGDLLFSSGGSVERLRIDPNGNLNQNSSGSGISYFKGSSEYIFGSNQSSPSQGGAEANVQIHAYKTRAQFSINAYMNNSGGPFMQMVSSRSGTVGQLGTVTLNNDVLGDIRFSADDGNGGVVYGAQIKGRAKTQATTNGVAGQIEFATAKDASSGTRNVFSMNEGGALTAESESPALYGYLTSLNNQNHYIDFPQWTRDSFVCLEMFGNVNPNSAGSGGYSDPVHMYVYRGVGWTGSRMGYYIYSVSVAPPARYAFPSGTGYSGNAQISAVWTDGSSNNGNETATSTNYVRLLIPNANNTYNFTKSFRIFRRR